MGTAGRDRQGVDFKGIACLSASLLSCPQLPMAASGCFWNQKENMCVIDSAVRFGLYPRMATSGVFTLYPDLTREDPAPPLGPSQQANGSEVAEG